MWQLCNAMMSWVGLRVELVVYRLSATRLMKVKRMGVTEILRKIWLFSANEIKSSESFSKQPTQLIVGPNSSLRYIIVTFTAVQNFICSWHLTKKVCTYSFWDMFGPIRKGLNSLKRHLKFVWKYFFFHISSHKICLFYWEKILR